MSENLRPLIESLQQSVDQLAEHLGPLPQQLAEFRDETHANFEEVRNRLDTLEGGVRDHSSRISRLES